MKKNGFTIVELMVSIGILVILFALTTITLTRLPSSASQTSSYDRLISDIRSQQTMSMAGYNNATYGISFTSDSYTLFPNTYTVTLDPNITFTNITFPGSQVTFTRGSGDVFGYSAGSDSVSISNGTTGEVKTIKINQYGATY